jgi:1-acyl-sn-glycerol-3-phosphate acyltransferase
MPAHGSPSTGPVIGFALSIMKVRWKVTGSGRGHVPPTGPAVIATNHVGYLDFVFVGAAHGTGADLLHGQEGGLRPSVSGPLMRGMKHMPVDRFGHARDSIDPSVAAMKQDQVIGMFRGDDQPFVNAS